MPLLGELIEPAGRSDRVAAGFAAAAIVVVTAVALPVASTPVAAVPALQPIFATIGIVTQTITAWLLYTQFRVTRDATFAALAGAYLFTVVMIALHLASYPELFTDRPSFAATHQGTVWLWTFWHGGFPLLVCVALMLRFRWQRGSGEARAAALVKAGRILLVAAPLLALLFGGLAMIGGGVLPPLTRDDADATLGPSVAAAIVLLLGGTAIGLCLRVTGLRERLSLWLAVALLAGLADTLLTLYGTGRFSIGWYAARLQSVIAASVVLAVLISEIATLYRRLISTHRALSERAVRDPLTGAFNRGYFNEQFPREFRRARRDGTSLSLLMIDVDQFKRYNESAGHLAGDRALAALVGAFMQTVQRPVDAVSRYGGEEFAVVLPDTNEAGARFVATAILTAVRSLALHRDDEFGPIVTVSIGVATMDAQAGAASTPDHLIEQADEALYRAKHRGRNRAEVHAPDDEALAASGAKRSA